jgi:hypothetical protein
LTNSPPLLQTHNQWDKQIAAAGVTEWNMKYQYDLLTPYCVAPVIDLKYS